MLGETGTGKSQLCKLLSNQSETFKPWSGIDSHTNYVISERVQYAHGSFTIYDTPGLNDSSDRDADHNRELHAQLSKVTNCNAFLLCCTVDNPRMTKSEKEIVHNFCQMFSKRIVSNLAIVFTRVKKRRYDDLHEEGGDSRQCLERVEWISNQFGPLTGSVPAFYIDSKEQKNPGEVMWQKQQVDRLLEWCLARTPFDCTGAKLVQTVTDALIESMDTLRIESAQATERARIAEEVARRAEEKARRAEARRAEEEKDRLRDKAKQYKKEAKKYKKEAKEASQRELDARPRQDIGKPHANNLTYWQVESSLHHCQDGSSTTTTTQTRSLVVTMSTKTLEENKGEKN